MSENSTGPTAHASYLGVRHDILAMLPKGASVSRVLEVGCAEGATGAKLKQTHPCCHVTGIELNGASAQQARGRLDAVEHGDAMTLLEKLASQVRSGARAPFDVVLCGDVLEHLLDPWKALRSIRALCRGYTIVSLPNVAHISTVSALLFRSDFPYRDRGIQDRTHLRFFGRHNLKGFFGQANFEELARRTHHRIIESPHRVNRLLEPIVKRVPFVNQLTAYQFVSLLK